MNTALCILLQCSSVNPGNFHSKCNLSVAMETACFLALLTKWVSLLRPKMRQKEKLKKERFLEESLKDSRDQHSTFDIHIQWTEGINCTNLQYFEVVLTYEVESTFSLINQEDSNRTHKHSCLHLAAYSLRADVSHLCSKHTAEMVFLAVLLIEKVRKAALNQQITSFHKILSLFGLQSPLVAKTPSPQVLQEIRVV